MHTKHWRSVGAGLLVWVFATAACLLRQEAKDTPLSAPQEVGGASPSQQQLSQPASVGDRAPRHGGTLTMAVERDISLLNPLVTTRSGDRAVRALMFESLAEIDEQGNIKPKLAESWD